MKLVIIESPFSGNIGANIGYARECMHDSLARGEAPFASHVMYAADWTLDDANPDEREIGMRAGFAWAAHADLTAVYADLGISKGMSSGIHDAHRAGRAVEVRFIRDGAK